MTTLDQETAGLFAGSYPLGRLLGRGGMADVYASVDARTGDPVAVKVFRDTDLGGADRRSAEVRTLTGLRHPNLVELIDAGTQDGCEFLVMALVEGPTLGQANRHRRLPLARTAQIGAAVGDALAYVHAGDVVHRDVKPDNVLLGPGPRVRLADFGIARTISATRLTQIGLVLGTAGYLAPEQVTGAEVGPPADVYALGLVLLECLSGHQEYPGAALESAMARLHRRPQLPAELPAGWAALLAAMTATDPAARPSAGSAAGALHQLAAAPHTTVAALAQAMGIPLGVPIAAAPAPPAAAVAPPAVAADADLGRPAAGDTNLRGGPRRRRRLLALAAASLLALIPVGVAGERALRFGSSPGQPTPGTQRAPVAGASAHPVAPPARHQPAAAARLGPPAAQAGRASAPQPSALAAGGSGNTPAAPAGHVGASSPPTATSTPVAGPAGSPGGASGARGAGAASGAVGGASRDGPASSSTTTGGPGPAAAGSPAAPAGSSPAASTGGAPGSTSSSPSGSSAAAALSSAPPSRSPGDATSGPATSGATGTAPGPGVPTSVATPSRAGSTTTAEPASALATAPARVQATDRAAASMVVDSCRRLLSPIYRHPLVGWPSPAGADGPLTCRPVRPQPDGGRAVTSYRAVPTPVAAALAGQPQSPPSIAAGSLRMDPSFAEGCRVPAAAASA